MSTNAQRRRAKRDAAHVAGIKVRVNDSGPNRAARRSSGPPRPKPIKALNDRQLRYQRAAERKAREAELDAYRRAHA